MKQLFILLLLLPALSFAQRQISTSPKWFIVDSDVAVIPAFNALVLTHANGYKVANVDSAADGITYTYKNSKNDKLDVFYRFEIESFPPGKNIKYFGVTAPNDVMIDFYNGY